MVLPVNGLEVETKGRASEGVFAIPPFTLGMFVFENGEDITGSGVISLKPLVAED